MISMKTMASMALCLLTCLLGVNATSGGTARACTNDYEGWGWTAPDMSMDDVIIQYWCGSNAQANANHYWNSLQLGETGDYWGDLAAGEGGVNCGNPNTHLIRLYNGAAAMDAVYAHMDNTTLNQSWRYNWLVDLVHPYSGAGYKATCDCCGIVASNPTPFGATKLHYVFFWQRSAPGRASTLIHEAVHDFEGHLDDDECAAGGSCDTKFGDSNAQTWQIIYLDHAIGTYWKASDGELDVINYGDDVCGYRPFLTEEVRYNAIWLANTKFDNNFHETGSPRPSGLGYVAQTGPLWKYGGWEYASDKNLGARWKCESVCDPADYLPGGAAACNEEYQSGNYLVNSGNHQRCLAANAGVAAGVTPSERVQLVNQFNSGKQKCIPGVSSEYLFEYCEDRYTEAANVAELEASWDIPDQPGYFDSGAALMACTRTYCESVFTETWVQPAREACYEWSDAEYGCMDAVCGSLDELGSDPGEESLPYFGAVQCRRHFIDNDGNAYGYFDHQSADDKCERNYIACRNAAAHQDWLDGKALGECNLTLTFPGAGLGPSGIANYDVFASSIVGTVSLGTFKDFTTAALVDDCMAGKQLCEKLRELAARVSADFIAVSDVPARIQLLADLPDPPPYESYANAVDDNMLGVAAVAASPAEATESFSQYDAARKLGETPEMLHSMSKALGKPTFFAVFGTQDLAPVFGASTVAAYGDQSGLAEIVALDSDTAAQTAALAPLADARLTRERVESVETAMLVAQAFNNLGETNFYEFIQSVNAATTHADLEFVLDELGVMLNP